MTMHKQIHIHIQIHSDVLYEFQIETTKLNRRLRIVIRKWGFEMVLYLRTQRKPYVRRHVSYIFI